MRCVEKMFASVTFMSRIRKKNVLSITHYSMCPYALSF